MGQKCPAKLRTQTPLQGKMPRDGQCNLQEAHMPVYFVLFAAAVAFFAWALCDAAAHADDALGER